MKVPGEVCVAWLADSNALSHHVCVLLNNYDNIRIEIVFGFSLGSVKFHVSSCVDFLYTIVPIFFFGYDQLLVKLQMTLENLPGQWHVDNPSDNGEKLVQKEKVELIGFLIGISILYSPSDWRKETFG